MGHDQLILRTRPGTPRISSLFAPKGSCRSINLAREIDEQASREVADKLSSRGWWQAANNRLVRGVSSREKTGAGSSARDRDQRRTAPAFSVKLAAFWKTASPPQEQPFFACSICLQRNSDIIRWRLTAQSLEPFKHLEFGFGLGMSCAPSFFDVNGLQRSAPQID
jgi:hypothetical protein